MGLHQNKAHPQSDAYSGDGIIHYLSQTLETLEKLRLIVVRYAGAMVGNAHYQETFFKTDGHLDFAAFWGVLNGIVYEVI